MLTDKEVDHIAKLARIELSAESRENIKKDLSSILEYVNQLESVDTAGVEPLYQVSGLQNVVRPDEHKGDWPMNTELAELLAGQAPHKHDGYVKVKSVKAK